MKFLDFSICPEVCGDNYCCGGDIVDRPHLSDEEVYKFKAMFGKDYSKYVDNNNLIKRNKFDDCVFLNTDKTWGNEIGCIFSKEDRPIDCLTLPVYKDAGGIYKGEIVIEDVCPVGNILISKFKKPKNKLKKMYCDKCKKRKTCHGNTKTSDKNIMFPFRQATTRYGNPKKGLYILDADCPITIAILQEELGIKYPKQ